MTDEIQDLAISLADAINTAAAVPLTFPQDFTAARRYLLLDEVADLEDAYLVSVLATNDERERISRNSDSSAFRSTWTIQLAAQKHVADDLAAVDALVALAKSVALWIEDNQQQVTLAGGAVCSLIDSQRPVLIARKLLKGQRIASSGALFRYGVRE